MLPTITGSGRCPGFVPYAIISGFAGC